MLACILHLYSTSHPSCPYLLWRSKSPFFQLTLYGQNDRPGGKCLLHLARSPHRTPPQYDFSMAQANGEAFTKAHQSCDYATRTRVLQTLLIYQVCPGTPFPGVRRVFVDNVKDGLRFVSATRFCDIANSLPNVAVKHSRRAWCRQCM